MNIQKKNAPKKSAPKSVKAQLQNINEEFAQSLNLPENAQLNATMMKKSPREFETRIELNIWHNRIFCHSVADTPAASLQIAKRKISRLVSDLHDRKSASKKRTKLKIERRATDDIGAI